MTAEKPVELLLGGDPDGTLFRLMLSPAVIATTFDVSEQSTAVFAIVHVKDVSENVVTPFLKVNALLFPDEGAVAMYVNSFFKLAAYGIIFPYSVVP